MMNVDIALRTPPSFCISKGPSFTKAKRIQTNILRSHIEFYAPKHKPRHRLKGKPTLPQRSYSESNLFFNSNYNSETMG